MLKMMLMLSNNFLFGGEFLGSWDKIFQRCSKNDPKLLGPIQADTDLSAKRLPGTREIEGNAKKNENIHPTR